MINIFKEYGGFCVWTDCEDGSDHDGRCVGSADTELEALQLGLSDLREDVAMLEKRIEELTPNPSCSKCGERIKETVFKSQTGQPLCGVCEDEGRNGG